MTTTGFGDGVLYFPVTPFSDHDEVDRGLLTEHITRNLDHHPGGVFAACGTGEYHALSAREVGTVLATARDAVNGIPLFGGVGGALGHALEVARAARDTAVDGLLVLPPYLVTGSDAGLIRYVERIIAVAQVPVILYHRANARYSPAVLTELLADPLVVGFKDGVGDVALAQEIVLTARGIRGDDFEFFNGLLTAELSQLAFQGIGIPRYSSAVFAMAPDIATAFYRAYRARDLDRINALLDGFYRPLVHLRDRVPGYGVALVKAGVRLGGLAVGGVRAPLTDLPEHHVAELERVLAAGRAVLAASAA